MQLESTDPTKQLHSTYSMQAVVQIICICMQIRPTDLANQLHSTYSMQAVVQMLCMRL